MRLIRFKADKVHGYLNFDIKFNDDVTFLIGINGTGKTSVLKIILGLISPSYNYLNRINFDYAQLDCWDNENNRWIRLECRKAEPDIFELSLTNDYESITGVLRKSQSIEDENDYTSEDEPAKLSILRREFEDQQIVGEIKKLSTPIFLGLDRRIYAGQKIDKIKMRHNLFQRKRMKRVELSDPLNLSLLDLQSAIYDYVRQSAFNQQKVNEDFRSRIISGSFEFIDETQFSSLRDMLELNEKRDKVIEAIHNLKMESILPQIYRFFDKMELVQKGIRHIVRKNRGDEESLTETEDNKPIEISAPKDIGEIEMLQRWFNNQPQLRRINEIIELSQRYQDQVATLFEPITRVVKLINSFLQENGKNIVIDGRGDIYVEIRNGDQSSIFELSSGEKQIITIIGHLIFFEEQFKKEPGVFIIDEPELSLHLAWQQIFVTSLGLASPKTQFILATHSPAIIENFDPSHCQDIAKLNY